MTRYQEIYSKTACNKITSFLPYSWDLNIYRGCQHHCKYCFALYSHKYMDSANFFDDIFIKKNIVEVLDKQLNSKRWKKEVINLGGVTDSYQPAEEQYKIMPEILKLLIKYKNPAVISTKSKLILRDYDLIAELSTLVPVNIACTITTVNEKVRELIEPNASTSQDRFNVLKEFAKTNVSVGLHIMPVIPEITDSFHNLSSLFATAKEYNVNYAITDILNLRGQTKIVFLNFIRDKLPHLYNKIKSLYSGAYVNKDYKKHFNDMIYKIRKQYTFKSKKKIFSENNLSKELLLF